MLRVYICVSEYIIFKKERKKRKKGRKKKRTEGEISDVFGYNL